MTETCDYCGKQLEEHDKRGKTKRRHVKIETGPVTALKGTVIFFGECDKKARNDDKYDL